LQRAEVLDRRLAEEALEGAGQCGGSEIELLRELGGRGAGTGAIAGVEVGLDAAPVPGVFIFLAEVILSACLGRPLRRVIPASFRTASRSGRASSGKEVTGANVSLPRKLYFFERSGAGSEVVPLRSDHPGRETTAFATSPWKSRIAVMTRDRDASSVKSSHLAGFHSPFDERAIVNERLSSKDDDSIQTLMGLP
jgi:hypothetical protein